MCANNLGLANATDMLYTGITKCKGIKFPDECFQATLVFCLNVIWVCAPTFCINN